MNHRITVVILLSLSSVGIFLGYFLMHPEFLKLCPGSKYLCGNQDVIFGIGHPLFWGVRWLPPFFFFLIFVRKEVYTTWWKVILPFVVIGFILITISPPLPELFTPDRTRMTELVTQGLVILSLAVIAWKYWRLWMLEKGKRRV